MATATIRLTAPLAETGKRTETATKPQRGFFARFFDAMVEARLRQAMRELEMHRHLVPRDEVEEAGYKASVTTDGALPFTR